MNNKRLLVVNSGFVLNVHFSIYEINSHFMRQHEGYEIDGLICNKAVKACDFQGCGSYGINDKVNWRRRCDSCTLKVSNRLNQFCDRLIDQNSLITNEDLESVDEIMENLGDHMTQDDYFNFKYHNIHVGKYAYDSFQYSFKLGRVDSLLIKQETAAYEFLKSTIIHVVSAEKLLIDYDMIMINDPGKSLWGCWTDVAFKMNKKVFNCDLNTELNHPPNHYYEIVPRIHSDSYEFRFRYPTFPGMKRTREVLENLSENSLLIEKGKSLLDKRFSKKKINEKDLRKQLNIPENKNVVAVFTHMCWDNSITFGDVKLNCFEQWLDMTYDKAINNKEFVWVFKLHPVEIIEDKIHPEFNSIKYLKTLMKEKPSDNIRLIDTLDITTFDLLPMLTCGVTLGGSVAYELPSFGKNCIVFGKGVHASLGFTVDSGSRAIYENLLVRIDELPELTTEAINKARAYTALLHTNDLSINVGDLYPENDYNAKNIYSEKLDQFTQKHMEKFIEIIHRENT